MFPEITLEDVYIYENKDKREFNDEHSQEIISFFPEIKKEYISA